LPAVNLAKLAPKSIKMILIVRPFYRESRLHFFDSLILLEEQYLKISAALIVNRI
jgi:hypothetical protein